MEKAQNHKDKIKETLIIGLRYQRLELEYHWRYFPADKTGDK